MYSNSSAIFVHIGTSELIGATIEHIHDGSNVMRKRGSLPKVYVQSTVHNNSNVTLQM